MDKFITSKKARAIIISVAVLIIGNLLSFLGLDLTDEQHAEMASLTGALIGLMVSIYMLAQGIADAGSGGKTSANYDGGIVPQHDLTSPDSASTFMVGLADFFESQNLKVASKRNRDKPQKDG